MVPGMDEPVFFRLFCVACALLYPLWGVACALIMPGSANGFLGRLGCSAVFLALALVSYRRPALARDPDRLLLVPFVLVTAHYGYLVWLNHFAPFWVVGVFITLGALDVCFSSVKRFVAYTLAVGAIAAVLVTVAPSGPYLDLLLLGVATEQILFGFALGGRAVLDRRVRELVAELERRGEQLAAQNAHLQQADALKSQFVSAVTHDLRTPLTTIRGFTEFLEEGLGGALAHEQQGYVHEIQLATDRLEALVEDLLDCARIDAGVFELHALPADMGGAVAEAVATLAPQAAHARVAVQTRLPEGELALRMDPHHIGRVLANLIGNALKFTPAGGTVRVSAGVEGAGDVLVEVADDGPGIAAEEQPKLFQRFGQLEAGRRRGGGTGLGLWIAKQLVEAHGGTIGVRSTPGKGATFYFRLPRGVS